MKEKSIAERLKRYRFLQSARKLKSPTIILIAVFLLGIWMVLN